MDTTKKQKRYDRIYLQLKALLETSGDPISNMATIAAILHHKFDCFFWTGFYGLKSGKLLVGPYQGAVACIELKENTGVCWTVIQQKQSIIVPDVHQFPGHIACDSRSKSEIVIPVKDQNGDIVWVMDVDSKELNAFDEADKNGLEKIVELIFN